MEHETVTAGTVTAGFVRGLPKAEVHVHLEGAIGLADLLEAAAAAGAPLPGPAATLFDTRTHHEQPEASELSAYLRFLDWEGSLFRTPEQLARLAYRFAARQAASGIRCTDVIVNPTHWPSWRGRLGALLDGLAAGLDEAEADGLGTVNLCVSLDRGQSAGEALELAEHLVQHRPRRVVALSVDGDEARWGRTAATFAPAFALALRAGLHRTVHAGESSGPEGVWDALTLLHADRIDHGIRAVEDPRLVDRLAEQGVPLGVCPTSNLTLGLVDDIGAHPVDALLRQGVVVTVNTDDPAPLATRLEDEWLACARAFGWGPDRLVELARASLEASFAPAETRRALTDELDRMSRPLLAAEPA